MCTGLEIAATIATVASAGIATYGQSQARSAQKKASRAQFNQTALENQRARLEAVREARIKRATILQNAENSGTSAATTTLGAAQSIEGQLEANLGFIGNTQANAQATYDAQSKGRAAQGIIALGEGIGDAGSVIKSLGGSGKKKKTVADIGTEYGVN